MKLVLVWYGRLDAKSARGLYPLFIYKYMNKIIVTYQQVYGGQSYAPPHISPQLSLPITITGPIAKDIYSNSYNIDI